MTIAICLKVGDGVVLGADSASSIMAVSGIQNVYFNAEKLFNLRKGLPIGAVTYGLGGIGLRSITSLAKDLRARFIDPDHDWYLDPQSYLIGDVAERMRSFFYEELYVPEVREVLQHLRTSAAERGDESGPLGPVGEYPAMGFLIAGFSANRPRPEVWEILIDAEGNSPSPRLLWEESQAGVITYRGQPEALNRLVFGYSSGALERLAGFGVPPEEAVNLVADFAQMAHSAMPIQDALDLVDFLANTTCGFVRFVPGHPTVAGPIDLAAITKHEQFKWVRRKHFYPAELNPFGLAREVA